MVADFAAFEGKRRFCIFSFLERAGSRSSSMKTPSSPAWRKSVMVTK